MAFTNMHSNDFVSSAAVSAANSSVTSTTLAVGSYYATYTLCQTGTNPANCCDAAVSITVDAPAVTPITVPVPALSHWVTALLMALVLLVMVRLPGARAKG